MEKIIQINSSSDLGGGPQVMWDIVDGLKDRFEFFILAPKGAFFDRYTNKDVLKGSFFKKVFKIRRVIKEQKPKIVHAHGTRAAYYTRLASIGLKVKVFYTLHGFHILRKRFKFVLLLAERILNHFTDTLICVSYADQELVLKNRAIARKKIKIIRNGIELDKFEVDKDLVELKRKELGLENSYVLLSVGRLHPQKDFLTLIKAAELVKIPNLKLLIIGYGPLEEELKKQASERVRFLGKRDDVPIFMALADALVLSTNWEGLALMPLEAGASRKPVIATKIGGVEESIVDGVTGLLFEKNSVIDLAEKIDKLYDMDRQHMGEKAYQYIATNFTKQRMIKEHEDCYSN